MARLRLCDYIAGIGSSALAPLAGEAPWSLTSRSEAIVEAVIVKLGREYDVANGVARHASAKVEAGAVVKPPAVIGPDCFVAAGAYLRGGTWLEADVIIGPGAELKSSFLFRGCKLAHLNFVGDSILGAGANLEAGSVIANYRNEADDKIIVLVVDGERIETGLDKFGALVGDGCRIGSNAVVAPGAILLPGTRVGRLTLVDQKPA